MKLIRDKRYPNIITEIQFTTDEQDALGDLGCRVVGSHIEVPSDAMPGHYVPVLVHEHMAKDFNGTLRVLAASAALHLQAEISWMLPDRVQAVFWRPGSEASFASVEMSGFHVRDPDGALQAMLDEEWHDRVAGGLGALRGHWQEMVMRSPAEAQASLMLLDRESRDAENADRLTAVLATLPPPRCLRRRAA